MAPVTSLSPPTTPANTAPKVAPKKAGKHSLKSGSLIRLSAAVLKATSKWSAPRVRTLERVLLTKQANPKLSAAKLKTEVGPAATFLNERTIYRNIKRQWPDGVPPPSVPESATPTTKAVSRGRGSVEDRALHQRCIQECMTQVKAARGAGHLKAGRQKSSATVESIVASVAAANGWLTPCTPNHISKLLKMHPSGTLPPAARPGPDPLLSPEIERAFLKEYCNKKRRTTGSAMSKLDLVADINSDLMGTVEGEMVSVACSACFPPPLFCDSSIHLETEPFCIPRSSRTARWPTPR